VLDGCHNVWLLPAPCSHALATGVEIGGSGTLTITLEETGESAGHIVIAGVAEVQVDEPVTSVVDPEQFALEIVSDSVDVLVVYGEWPACSS